MDLSKNLHFICFDLEVQFANPLLQLFDLVVLPLDLPVLPLHDGVARHAWLPIAIRRGPHHRDGLSPEGSAIRGLSGHLSEGIGSMDDFGFL